MKQQKLKVAIFGGSGFVGRNIVEQLDTRYELLAPTRQELNLLEEKSVQSFLAKATPDVVIHAVNIGGTRKDKDTELIFFNNLQMFFNVVRAKCYYKKLIFLGSGAEYDKRNPLIKVKETDFGKSIPADYYGLYKYICSTVIAGLDGAVSLRIFGLYGKYEDYSIKFISNTICKSIFNIPIVINQNVFFEYVYIDDFINILQHFIDHTPKHKFYNIGTGEKVELKTLAKIINNLAEKKQNISLRKKSLSKEYTCDTKLLKTEISNFRFTPVEVAIRKLYSYYEENKLKLDKQRLLDDHI
ncbi:MAG TPA: NAD(P)-dependent oxidoreductase [Patescibacteria group bacterium]|nr:NAD(P)-dependent oxidoreductase [Patescibacteria group bacterium]